MSKSFVLSETLHRLLPSTECQYIPSVNGLQIVGAKTWTDDVALEEQIICGVFRQIMVSKYRCEVAQKMSVPNVYCSCIHTHFKMEHQVPIEVIWRHVSSQPLSLQPTRFPLPSIVCQCETHEQNGTCRGRGEEKNGTRVRQFFIFCLGQVKTIRPYNELFAAPTRCHNFRKRSSAIIARCPC